MIRFLVLLLFLFIGPHAFAQPAGCTTTTCTGSALPAGYLTVSGNQFQNNGTNVRLACAEFNGQPNDGSMAALRLAGFNCIRLGWRDAYVGSAPTFDAEFTSAPWLTHGSWVSGDQYAFVATAFPTGTSQGPTWWANPISTPSAASVYSQSGSTLNLSLIQNPGGNGISNTTLGALINNQQTPGGNVQLYGDHQFSVAVQAIPGFLFQWDIECQPATCSDGSMEIDVGIWTDGSNVQHVRFWSQASGLGNPIYYETTSVNITTKHVYEVNWQSDFLTFYIDGVQKSQVANPGGNFKVDGAFTYFLTSDATYFAYGPAPTLGNLPATANIDFDRVYQNKPSSITPPAGCNSLSQLTSCVANASVAGLDVILDHRGNEDVPNTSSCWTTQQNGLWYDSGGIASGSDGCGNSGTITSANFQSNWVTLASAFNANPTVIGAELHQNPLVFGAAGTRTTTTAPGGGFTAANGQIFDPNGVAWVGRGINITIEDIQSGNVTPAKLQALYPRANWIRVVNQFGGNGGGYHDSITPGDISTQVAAFTNLGIRLDFSDYASTNAGAGGQCRSGSDLTGANSWYQTWSAFYKNNPFVAWESENECQGSGGNVVSNWQTQMETNYAAVRAGCPNCQFNIGLPDGNFQINYTIDQTWLNTATNVIFDGHPYLGNAPNWCNSTQSVCNAGLVAGLNVFKSLSTNTETHIPMVFGEWGDSASGQGSCCDAFWPNNLTGIFATMSTGGSISTNNGSGAWTWWCPCGSTVGDTLTSGGSNPTIIDDGGQFGARYQTAIASAPGSGPTPATGGTGGPATVTWGGGGSNSSDILQMCSSVGTAINAANSGMVIFCPGPINGPTGTKLLNGVTKPTDCTNISDLSNAGANAMTGFPVNKMAYSAHFYPQSINGTGCVDSGATLTADLNAYFGYLEVTGRAPVDVLEMGCSCDGIVGNATDENAWGSAFTQYLNGMATGGPQFTGSNQPMSTNWWVWSNPQSLTAGLNPDGIRNSDNTTLNAGQQIWWDTLLYQIRNVTVTTTWNPSDEVAIALTNHNLTATTSTTTPNGVRSTTSKGSGLYCWAVTASTMKANLVTGVANSLWSFVGGTANSIDYVPADGQAVFTNNVFLTGGGSNSVSGEELDMCANFNTQLFYVSSPTMVSVSGAGSWNNSNTCTPNVSACGLSFAGMTGPYYLMFYDPNGEANAVGVLNTTGPFSNAVLSSLPSGYSTWDQATTAGTRRPIINILGSNDNFAPANDNVMRVSYPSSSLMRSATRR